MRQNFYTTGFILSTLQILCAIACPQGQASDFTGAKEPPIRIPLNLFDSPVTGELSVKISQEQSKPLMSSPLIWEAQPTTLPPPLPNSLADFRDYTGCARFDSSDIAVCFNVMPDVQSVGVNSKEMYLQNVDQYVSEQAGSTAFNQCPIEIKNIHFAKANRTEEQITINFTGEAIPNADCKASKKAVEIQLVIQTVAE